MPPARREKMQPETFVRSRRKVCASFLPFSPLFFASLPPSLIFAQGTELRAIGQYRRRPRTIRARLGRTLEVNRVTIASFPSPSPSRAQNHHSRHIAWTSGWHGEERTSPFPPFSFFLFSPLFFLATPGRVVLRLRIGQLP